MSFNQIYSAFYKEIYRFAFQLCLSHAESEDLLQETFMRLFKEMTKGVELKQPKAWLYKVVLNLWRNKYKKNKMVLLKNIKDEYYGDTNQTPETDFIHHEKRKFIFESIDQLPLKDRNILVLYHDGLSYEEIAEVLDIKKGSVGTTLRRSIQKFKMILKNQHHELFE